MTPDDTIEFRLKLGYWTFLVLIGTVRLSPDEDRIVSIRGFTLNGSVSVKYRDMFFCVPLREIELVVVDYDTTPATVQIVGDFAQLLIERVTR